MVFQSPPGETEIKECHNSGEEVSDAVGNIYINDVKSDFEGYYYIDITDDNLSDYRNDQRESDIAGTAAYPVINM